MPTPNIFQYATKELSQDALICWLVACAVQAEGDLRRCGLDFIGTLMRHGREPRGRPYVVSDVWLPEAQYKGIDVYFQARINDRLVSFVIEDKIATTMHGDQLKRYREVVRRDDRPEDEFRLVYYKTGYIFDDERAEAERSGYAVFGAEDMQHFLSEQKRSECHEIIRQYREHINQIVKDRTDVLAKWDWTYDFVQHEFMVRLRDALAESRGQWDSAFGEDPGDWNSVDRGVNRGGDPWTQYWFCSALFWRLDGYQPLRLRVWTEGAKQLYSGWSEDTWAGWISVFRRLQLEHGLVESPFPRRMYYGGELVQEGTVGTIKLPQQEADRTIPQILKLHGAFVREIASVDLGIR